MLHRHRKKTSQTHHPAHDSRQIQLISARRPVVRPATCIATSDCHFATEMVFETTLGGLVDRFQKVTPLLLPRRRTTDYSLVGGESGLLSCCKSVASLRCSICISLFKFAHRTSFITVGVEYVNINTSTSKSASRTLLRLQSRSIIYEHVTSYIKTYQRTSLAYINVYRTRSEDSQAGATSVRSMSY